MGQLHEKGCVVLSPQMVSEELKIACGVELNLCAATSSALQTVALIGVVSKRLQPNGSSEISMSPTMFLIVSKMTIIGLFWIRPGMMSELTMEDQEEEQQQQR